MSNPTPYVDGNGNTLYYSEWCKEHLTYTVYIGAGCDWASSAAAPVLSQDGLDDAEAKATFTCQLLPSDTTTQGEIVFNDWSNTPLQNYPSYPGNGGSTGFSIDTKMVPFPDGQQLVAHFTRSATFTASSGWSWPGGGGCTFTNPAPNGGYLTATCDIWSNSITVTQSATATPTATATAQTGSCAITVVGTINVGNGQTVLRMAVTPSSGEASGIIQWIPAGGQNTVVFANVIDGQYIYNQDGSYINTGIGSRTFQTSGNVDGVNCATTTSQQFIIT